MKRILVVEDDRITGECIKSWLNKNGYRAEAVLNGEAALSTLAVECYDVLVVDLYMPGIDGLALSRKIREIIPSYKIPIILVTAGGAGAIRQVEDSLKELSPATVIQKPFTMEYVKEVIHHISPGGSRCPRPSSSLPPS